MISFIKKTLVITELEIRKVLHDPTETITRSVQPALWILIFGQVFSRMHPIPGSMNYMDFMAPGILAQSVLFVSIFFGIAIIWERDLGLVHKLLASPAPRTALVLGKALSAGIRAIPIVTIIYIIAVLMGIHVNWNLLNITGVLIMVFLGAILFSTFSLIIATLVKTRERFMGFGQLMTMPLFFASNAIYPIEIMPGWLKFIAHINPLTYMVNVLRILMIQNSVSSHLFIDYAIVAGISIAFVLTGGILYKRVIY